MQETGVWSQESPLFVGAHGERSVASVLPEALTVSVDSVTTCLSSGSGGRGCVLLGLSSVSALLLLVSGLLRTSGSRSDPGRGPAGSSVFFYCLLGDVCSTVGAVLSAQLYVQVLMGAFAAVMDAVNIVSSCFLVFLCRTSKRERKLTTMRRRRRQHLLAVCALMAVVGGSLKTAVRPPDGPLGGRKLLRVTLADNTEILGYTLGVISLVILGTARFPAVCRVYRGQTLTTACLFSGLLYSSAGSLYAAAILLYDTRTEFLLRVMPWLLSALCCTALEVLIVLLHCYRRRTRQQRVVLSPDMEKLLPGSGVAAEEGVFTKQHRTRKNKSELTLTEMGQYMDVSLHPVCLQNVSLSKEEAEDGALGGTMPVINVDNFCFSDGSCDSSPVSTDLEWDFEEANGEWRELRANQQRCNVFPVQHPPENPNITFDICSYAMSGLAKRTQEGGGGGGGFSAVSLTE